MSLGKLLHPSEPVSFHLLKTGYYPSVPPTCPGFWKDQNELMDVGTLCFYFLHQHQPMTPGNFSPLGDLSQLAFYRKTSLNFPQYLYEPDDSKSSVILTAFLKAESIVCAHLLLGSSSHLTVTWRASLRPSTLTEMELSGTLTIKNSLMRSSNHGKPRGRCWISNSCSSDHPVICPSRPSSTSCLPRSLFCGCWLVLATGDVGRRRASRQKRQASPQPSWV